jgi:membrane protein implicated in regulation of membrane protease activity
MDILQNMVFWHWWLIAVLIMSIELFAPASFFLWCGIAATIVGAVLLVIPDMGWQIQFILFSILSVVSVIIGRKYLRRSGAMDSDQPNLNRRSEQYIGNTYTLDEAIVNGTARIKVGDSYWRAEGSDMDAGNTVKVTKVDGATLIVEKVE